MSSKIHSLEFIYYTTSTGVQPRQLVKERIARYQLTFNYYYDNAGWYYLFNYPIREIKWQCSLDWLRSPLKSPLIISMAPLLYSQEACPMITAVNDLVLHSFYQMKINLLVKVALRCVSVVIFSQAFWFLAHEISFCICNISIAHPLNLFLSHQAIFINCTEDIKVEEVSSINRIVPHCQPTKLYRINYNCLKF